MFASQLIYTACGKDRTGAFSVWAKSADITKAESDEITKMMLYKRPANLPYEPTEEELESLFPKKFGYFLLSSGRYCVAQASYIGKVYSDLDMRSGNYIIHAYVLDDITGLYPMTFIGSDIFKTSLTYDEWHEHDAPEDLPQIELAECSNALSKDEIDIFFQREKCNYLEFLLQAIINTCYTGDKVTFHDTDANLKYWYKAISLCVPKCMQKDLTFCSFFTPTPPVPSQSMSAIGVQTEVKIKNVSPTVLSSIFSYAQEVRNGKNAFDFENRVINETISVSKYVKTIVKQLKTNLFNAFMMVDSIDKLMKNCNCSIDEAAALHSLQKGNLDWFDDISELLNALDKAKLYLSDAMSGIADALYDNCVIQDRWLCCPQMLPIYTVVFDYSEKADKAFIVGKYIDKHSSFGISDNVECDEYARKMIESAPFLWVNFIDYLFETGNFKKYFSMCGDTFNSRYLVYVSLIDELKELTDEQKEIAYKYFLELMVAAIKTESISQFDALLNGIKKLGEKWETWLVKNSLATLMKDGAKATEVCNPEFLLNLVKRLSNPGLALLILKQLAAANSNDGYFISQYVAKAETARDTFDRYEAALRDDGGYAEFIDNVEMYRFGNKKTVTRNDLLHYYKLYYRIGKDKGLFRKKLGEYLSGIPENSIIEECSEIYSSMFAGLADNHFELLECLSKMASLIFNLDFTYLIKYSEKRGMNSFTQILKRLHDNGLELPSKYYVLKLGMDTKAFSKKIDFGRNGASKKDAVLKLENKEYYKLLNSSAEVDLFVEHFIADVLNMYLEISARREFEYVLEDCFEELIESRKFSQSFFEAVEELDKKSYVQVMTDLFSYAFGQSTRMAERLRRLINAFLDDVGRGKRKKVFATVSENVIPEYEKSVRRFIDKYQKEHETFFDRLFGGSSKNDRQEKESKTQDKDTRKQWKK